MQLSVLPRQAAWITLRITTGGIETIDYLESALTHDEYVGFLKGNILKYLSRERFKNGIEDCKKAKWYMDRLVSFSEKA